MLLSFINCRRNTTEVAQIDFAIDSAYTMRATDVSTLISDSGITRYRLTTPEWLIYSRQKDPHWKFPIGIYVEKFDSLFAIEGSIKSDSAYYYTEKSEWVLLGNVLIQNLRGERFETQKVIWNQRSERVFSDQFIRIDQGDKIITGIGFDSNQDMTQYTIFNPQGIFPIDQQHRDSTDAVIDSVSQNATAPLPLAPTSPTSTTSTATSLPTSSTPSTTTSTPTSPAP